MPDLSTDLDDDSKDIVLTETNFKHDETSPTSNKIEEGRQIKNIDFKNKQIPVEMSSENSDQEDVHDMSISNTEETPNSSETNNDIEESFEISLNETSGDNVITQIENVKSTKSLENAANTLDETDFATQTLVSDSTTNDFEQSSIDQTTYAETTYVDQITHVEETTNSHSTYDQTTHDYESTYSEYTSSDKTLGDTNNSGEKKPHDRSTFRDDTTFADQTTHNDYTTYGDQTTKDQTTYGDNTTYGDDHRISPSQTDTSLNESETETKTHETVSQTNSSSFQEASYMTETSLTVEGKCECGNNIFQKDFTLCDGCFDNDTDVVMEEISFEENSSLYSQPDATIYKDKFDLRSSDQHKNINQTKNVLKEDFEVQCNIEFIGAELNESIITELEKSSLTSLIRSCDNTFTCACDFHMAQHPLDKSIQVNDFQLLQPIEEDIAPVFIEDQHSMDESIELLLEMDKLEAEPRPVTNDSKSGVSNKLIVPSTESVDSSTKSSSVSSKSNDTRKVFDSKQITVNTLYGHSQPTSLQVQPTNEVMQATESTCSVCHYAKNKHPTGVYICHCTTSMGEDTFINKTINQVEESTILTDSDSNNYSDQEVSQLSPLKRVCPVGSENDQVSSQSEISSKYLRVVSKSSRSQEFWRITLLQNIAKFTEKLLCLSVYVIKVQVYSLQLHQKQDPNIGVLQ